jgi:hypothetical protein
MQKVIWIPRALGGGSRNNKPLPIPYADKIPSRLWILFLALDPVCPPSLPYAPVHGVNAYLESYQHDWSVRDGFLHYHSHSSDGGAWALLEFVE